MLVVLIILMLASVISSIVCVITLVKKSRYEIDIDERLKEFDKIFEEAVTEINKIATLIDNEINEKYRSILFLYNLIEDKTVQPVEIKEEPEFEIPPELEPVSKASMYDKVKELSIYGHTVAEIAKTLGIGQGEVQLIIDLYSKREKI